MRTFFHSDSNEEDDDDVMQGVTEEEFAILKKKAQNLKVRREVKSLPAAKPAKADHHDGTQGRYSGGFQGPEPLPPYFFSGSLHNVKFCK